MVNDEVFALIRAGKAKWLRGDITRVAADGVIFNQRAGGVPKGGPGKEVFVSAGVLVYATGFARPSLSVLRDRPRSARSCTSRPRWE